MMCQDKYMKLPTLNVGMFIVKLCNAGNSPKYGGLVKDRIGKMKSPS